MLAAAAVEPVGDVALAEVVLLDVGVEQEQRDPADPGEPDPGGQPPPAGQGEGDVARRAVLLGERGEGQLVRVEHRVVLLLPALAGEGLAEVAVPVEQADADQGDAQVAGGLEVVTGQDAEPAGVLRQGGGDAEFRREVGDRGGQPGRLRLVPALASRVLGEILGRGGQPAQEPVVPGQLGQARGGHAAQQPHGVAPAAAHRSGSTDWKRSRVSACQDQRRLCARSLSGLRASGSTGRTVNLRMAFKSPTFTRGVRGFGPHCAYGPRHSRR